MELKDVINNLDRATTYIHYDGSGFVAYRDIHGRILRESFTRDGYVFERNQFKDAVDLWETINEYNMREKKDE